MKIGKEKYHISVYHVQVKYCFTRVNWQLLLFFSREAIEALAAKREEDLQEIREELELEMSNTRARLEEEVECKKKVGDHLMAGLGSSIMEH